MSKKQKRRKPRLFPLLLMLALVLTVASFAVGNILKNEKLFENKKETESTQPLTEETITEEEKETLEENKPKVVATATVGNSGDVLVHTTVLKASLDKTTGKYDFNRSFELLRPYVSAADYAVVNAEFSVSVDNTYSALPFRVPSTIVEALKNCG
ncbi:MAG: CapA family protein, partial [Clostridia bacterium]|nr:CapA family protein [Clostridia bacterium]